MTTKTLYPNTYASTSGGKFQPFKQSTLKNLHSKSTNTYADTELIHGKKDPLNRPGTVTVSNFKCGLPTGSLVTKVTVYYAHSKVAYNGKVCNIPAPEISLMNDTKVIKYTSSGKATTKTGKAPTTNIVSGSVSFSSSWDYSLFNSSKFGVRVNYPTNANNEEGYMRLYYVYLVLEYKAPNYSLKCIGAEGNTGYNGDDYTVAMELSNLNSTKYTTTVILTAPAGFTYEDATGNGTIETVQNNVYRWTPKMINGTMSIALRFSVNVTFPSGAESYTGEFVAKEQLLGKGSRYNATITPKPANIDVLPEDEPAINLDENTLRNNKTSVYANQEIDLTMQVDLSYLPHDYTSYEYYYEAPQGLTLLQYYKEGDTWVDTRSFIYPASDEGTIEVRIKSPTEGYYEIPLMATYSSGSEPDIQIGTLTLFIVPNGLSTPFLTIMRLNQEELNRLGDENYIVQTYLNEISNLEVTMDWFFNYRIGVFNNPIWENISVITIPPEDENDSPTDIVYDSTDYDSLTPQEIFDNADYWSNTVPAPLSYENLECKFHYNKDYPVYIILSGEYPEEPGNNQVKFTEPCIIEESYFDGHEFNGTYPIPIENTRNGDGDFAELNINSLGTASPVIYYDLPFDEDYGTNENTAIRGIEVSGVIEQNTDDINIYAKLKAPTGESRTRSLNLDALDTDVNSDNRFILGGMGDLWGLSTLDIVNLEDWEIEFLADNTVNSETGTINYRDISLTVYISEIDSQNITCKVENEDISYYGAFLTALEIPEGLNTAIKYIDIDGTDTHYPYQQNINPKEITLELDVGDCDLTGNTLTLRDITRLFTTKRDKYNRPIPKRIEFSHYPDMFWEYLMEDAFDNPIEILSYPKVKIKLTVPSGTAYKKTATSSNRVGYVNGLVNVNPVIVIKPTANLITISETLTDQNFHMGYNGDLTDKVIVIDCEDRIAWLKTDEDDEDGENISYAVDINSDWFSIIEEYQFETDGCVIKDISYIERW